jgi:hypothetical protein
MRSGPSLKLLTGIALVLTAALTVSAQQRTSDSDLSETLSWMDNSYNPHPDVSGAYGHGRTRSYQQEVLWSGSTETFTYNGCQMTLHTEEDPAAKLYRDVVSSLSETFNLRDINPQSIEMRVYESDPVEIRFKTRLEAPVIDVYSHSIYRNLKGSDHEGSQSSKANEAWFKVDDVEYAKRLTRAFRHAVELCGGKPEPF